MDLWIPITIAAAFSQNLRFMLQKSLATERLSASGATLARFLYSAPLVVILGWVYLLVTDQATPATSLTFWSYALIGGISQILATVFVVALFKHRNFAVGITLKKTEVMMTAMVGFLVLGDAITMPGFLAILLGLIAVLILAKPPQADGGFFDQIFNQATGFGLLSGAFFALSAVGYRGAVLSLETEDLLIRAGFTLALVTTIQTGLMMAWLVWREPGQITRVLQAWRVASLVGVTSMCGSLFWFLAFSLQTAAYVFALGQIEMIFSFLAATFVFKEKTTPREMSGIALLTGSIIALVFVT
jgi:drug/metabolite transporter (DMT)-like permease